MSFGVWFILWFLFCLVVSVLLQIGAAVVAPTHELRPDEELARRAKADDEIHRMMDRD
jgi:Na+-transporting methylmalonyl-CoA/oxaloacetate decarboxylase gamma subunit